MDAPLARRLSLPRTAELRERMSAALRRYAERDGRGYPDWAMRYQPIVRRLRLDHPTDGLILEVGANENGLARFVSAATAKGVVAVDCSMEHVQAARETQGIRAVVADIEYLPFVDAAFEVVVSVDTLEHVPTWARDGAVSELGRVLAPVGRAAISFPTGEASAHAEESVAESYELVTGGSLRWLEEHVEQGLPDPRQIAAIWRHSLENTHRVHATGNANLRAWTAVWRVLLATWPRRGNAIAQVVLRALTPLLARAHWGRCYRTILYAEPSDE